MWQIREHARVDKALARETPVEILKRYEMWKDIVRLSGPAGLRQIRGFHDEPLRGEWAGCRSSRLDLQWRVIYRVEAERVTVLVIRVTPHDYRRG